MSKRFKVRHGLESAGPLIVSGSDDGETITGYIEIEDIDGNVRKLAVIS